MWIGKYKYTPARILKNVMFNVFCMKWNISLTDEDKLIKFGIHVFLKLYGHKRRQRVGHAK